MADNQIFQCFFLLGANCQLDCPLSKGNQAATPKIERPNGKNTKSKFFFEIGQELVRTAHLKAQ